MINFTQEEMLEMKEKNQNGYTLTMLAQENFCHPRTISAYFKKHGITPVLNQQRTLPLKSLADWYEAGMSTVAIAEKCKCSIPTVNKYLRLAGVKLRSKNRKGRKNRSVRV